MIKLSEIKKNPKNPRTIKDEKFHKLCQSINDFPKMLKLRPIIVDENMMVLGGNMRLKALIENGIKEVPNEYIKKVNDLTEDEKREFIIKDNLGYGDWDENILNLEWGVQQLEDWGLELEGVEPYTPENKEKEIDGLETENKYPSCGYKW